MLAIQPAGFNYKAQQPTFKAHLPRNFSSMMNHIYKKTPEDLFDCKDIMHVETILDCGREVGGTAYFFHGKYHSLVMDEGCENFRQEFMRTALKRYNMHMASPDLQKKLGYIA